MIGPEFVVPPEIERPQSFDVQWRSWELRPGRLLGAEFTLGRCPACHRFWAWESHGRTPLRIMRCPVDVIRLRQSMRHAAYDGIRIVPADKLPLLRRQQAQKTA